MSAPRQRPAAFFDDAHRFPWWLFGIAICGLTLFFGVLLLVI